MSLRASLGVAAALTYALFSYWGIRSPDGEVMYRTAESLVRHADFAIEPLEQWPEFGVAPGRGGKLYGKYGPAVPVLAAPLAWLGLELSGFDALRPLSAAGPSHYAGDGYAAMRERRLPAPPEPHLRRSVVAAFNVVVGALAAVSLLALLERLGVSRAGALAGTAAFAFGTPLLPYSGTFFSEPLVALCLLRTVLALVTCDPDLGGAGWSSRRLLAAGGWLGLAMTAHITAALWLPFLLAYAGFAVARRVGSWGASATALGALAAGPGVAAAVLLLFNYARFGRVLDTGRPAGDFAFDAPWLHALPLLAAWGKGLFVLCPLALLGLGAWPLMVRRQRVLASILIGGVLARVMLFASFHDWHGGFGPGPRYLLPEIAVLALGAGLALDRWLGRGGWRGALATALVCGCIAQQVWIASGEVFSWGHRWKAILAQQGRDVFAGDLLYRDFALSPLAPAYLRDGVPGPALARALEIRPAGFAALGALLLCAGVALSIERARRAGAAGPSSSSGFSARPTGRIT